jgi:hypothetical protein
MDIPIGNIITGIITVLAVVLANKLSSSQSGRAKLWDLRRQTYGVILSELGSVERLCAVIDYCKRRTFLAITKAICETAMTGEWVNT